MANYSQNNEDQIILEYFGNTVGAVLDIGANDGRTFSNSLALIEKGWDAILIEPHPIAFKKLQELHKENIRATCFNFAIADIDGKIVLHCNAPHISGDIGLLSTTIKEETKRFPVEYNEVEVDCYTWKTFDSLIGKKYDFISIDAEGMDYAILSQINLKAKGARMVCVEYNSIEPDKYTDYCSQFGLKEIHRNAENIIMAL